MRALLLLALASPSFAFDPNLLAQAAMERTEHAVIYNPAYFAIDYPMGDVPKQFGVCTDVVIRALRQQGIDLQQAVHQDMKTNFSAYPAKRIWNQSQTDRNIDHRRVPNLETYFERMGYGRSLSTQASDYLPGDIVSWRLDNGRPHIGVVVAGHGPSGAPWIVHNIGWGPKKDDMLFDYKITGHFRPKAD